MDVEGVEGESLTDNRESNTETPRRRDSSDPVNLSLNSGTFVTSDDSHDIHRSGLRSSSHYAIILPFYEALSFSHFVSDKN